VRPLFLPAPGARWAWDYGAVNGRLNRTVGITNVTEGTADQLEARLAAARKWLFSGDNGHVAL